MPSATSSVAGFGTTLDDVDAELRGGGAVGWDAVGPERLGTGRLRKKEASDASSADEPEKRAAAPCGATSICGSTTLTSIVNEGSCEGPLCWLFRDRQRR